MRTALVWLRRDLRLADNPALQAAARAAETVLPVYIHAPDEEAPWAPGAASRWWLHQSLLQLDADLRQRGGALVVRQGPSLQCLRELLRQLGAGAVFWNRLYEPAIRQRDAVVEQALRQAGVQVESFEAALLFRPGELKTAAGEPYRVFTPFWRAAQARFPVRAPSPVPRRLSLATLPDPGSVESLGLLPGHHWREKLASCWTPGEAGARKQMERFGEEALPAYARGRDFPADSGTSRLSPHLHFGEISVQQLAARIQFLQAARSVPGVAGGSEVFLKELGWREFAHHLLVQFPHIPEEPMDRRFTRLAWRRDAGEDLQRWQQGRTGFPIVDAGMRELWATGWMHNRVRMIVASLLTKNLLLPWQDGTRWFWDTLVDADLANNTQGWQWVAGCGADAAPFFRIFNPLLQSQKFDGTGAYLRRWLPELAGLDGKAIHAPWLAAVPPRNYPAPIIDLKTTRERALGAFKRLKAKG